MAGPGWIGGVRRYLLGVGLLAEAGSGSQLIPTGLAHGPGSRALAAG
jgi:hypothetical protein